MKSALLFLAGLLVGANAVYFLMVHARVPQPSPVAVVATAAQAPAPRPTTPVSAASGPTDAAVGPPGVAAIPPAPARHMPSTAPGVPQDVAIGSPAKTPVAASDTTSAPAPTTLMIPVSGVAAGQLSDTFNDTRGSERRHEALDIMAARGTPVLAASNGKVEKLFDSKPGGLTIYQFDPTRTYAYYYAHLDRYAPGLRQGKTLRRGEVIGYVGSTGNASPDAPHLHFAIFVLGPEKRWWEGTAIDPYPLLSAARRGP